MSATYRRSNFLVALTAVAGAVGTAAMMSTASAPTARADDFTDIIAAINGDYTEGSAAFSSAFADFGSDNVSQGLAQLIDSFNDDVLGPIDNLTLGTVEALEGDPITGTIAFGISAPTDFADGLADAQSVFASGESLLAGSATLFGAGDFSSGTADLILGGEFASIVPIEELLLGTLASF